MKTELIRAKLAQKSIPSKDPDLLQAQQNAAQITRLFNNQVYHENRYDYSLLHELFGKIGAEPYIEPNFNCSFGFNIFLGNNVFFNHDVTILDYAPVTFGNNINVAPKTTFITVNQATDPALRKTGACTAAPITIEDGVWIGANAIILPGVTIGENTIIGAGAVVTMIFLKIALRLVIPLASREKSKNETI
ncbi:sugar O-acetyltransferase [Ligilactobacillus equi]|uniref:sugar O-acetyltransferase n=1 Tax=Ligilactobacillus equi TaxID=137357 RepID=UPI000AB5879D|nr:sugar O-acetyltransferase [Ligilactobacillus equi]